MIKDVSLARFGIPCPRSRSQSGVRDQFKGPWQEHFFLFYIEQLLSLPVCFPACIGKSLFPQGQIFLLYEFHPLRRKVEMKKAQLKMRTFTKSCNGNMLARVTLAVKS